MLTSIAQCLPVERDFANGERCEQCKSVGLKCSENTRKKWTSVKNAALDLAQSVGMSVKRPVGSLFRQSKRQDVLVHQHTLSSQGQR